VLIKNIGIIICLDCQEIYLNIIYPLVPNQNIDNISPIIVSATSGRMYGQELSHLPHVSVDSKKYGVTDIVM